MNAAKLPLSPGPSEDRSGGGKDIYHNPNRVPGDPGTIPDWDLSPEEKAFASEPAWMLMKNRIVQKTVAWFADLSENMHAIPPQNPALKEICLTPPKISKGENFKGLPWVVLDYPRRFGKTDILAIRTLFWWGKYFSVTLHLKGEYKKRYAGAIASHTPALVAAGFHIGIADNEWRHELEEDNYRSLGGMSASEMERIISANDFLKLSAECGLGHGEETGRRLLDLHGILMSVLE